MNPFGLGRFQELPTDSVPGKTLANVKRTKMQKRALRSIVHFEESLVIFYFFQIANSGSWEYLNETESV